MEIKKILQKYPLEPYPLDRKLRIEITKLRYEQLKTKWGHKVAPRWYGFDLFDVPIRWLNIVDEFLDYINRIDPTFEIHQIKLKWGGLRFYIEIKDEFLEKINEEIRILERTLQDSELVF